MMPRWYCFWTFSTSFSVSWMICSLLAGVRRSSVAKRQAAARRFAEADLLHAVEQVDGLAPAEQLVAVGDDAAEVLAGQRQVVERHLRLEDVVEDHPADRGVRPAPFGLRGISSTRDLVLLVADLADDLLLDRQPDLDAGMDAELLLGEGQEHLGRAGEDHAVAGLDPVRRRARRGESAVR